MKRALYLSDKLDINIQIDGPSLLISIANKAPRRVPFGLLDRVYILGDFRISSEIICAFGQYNIPVLFFKDEKTPIGIMMSLENNSSLFNIRLIKALFDFERRILLNNWYKSMKRRCELILIKSYVPNLLDVFSSRGIQEEDVEVIIEHITQPLDRNYFAKIMSFLRAIHYDLVVSKVKNCNLDVHLGIKNSRIDFGLVKDICEITDTLIVSIVVDILRSKNGYDKLMTVSKVLTSEVRKTLIEKYESRRNYISFEIDIVIESLFRHLREISV